jgi:ATP-dependent Lhr-like helicase
LEARPASAQKYSEFLTRWQHLHPEHQLSGLDGVRACLGQLEALWLPFSVWETDILSRRIKDFKIESVDNLCLSAEIVWTGQSQDPDKPGNVAFLARQGVAALSPLLYTIKTENGVTLEKDKVVQCLKNRGASFLIDLVADTGLDSRTVNRILWEMIWSGEVTHDYFKLLRSGKPPEASKVQTRENQRESAVNFQSSRRDFYRNRSRIAKSFTSSPSANPGRWMLLSSLMRYQIDIQESLEILARVLLERYGIVAKDLVQRTGEPDVLWGNLYEVYQRMELSGEIERGYFVDGLAGAQFGLPDAVDELMDRYHKSSSRIFNPSPDAHKQAPVLVNVCDPAYLWSAVGPFDGGFGRLNRLPSNYAVLLNGLPVLTLEMGAKRLSIRQDTSVEDVETAIAALPRLVDHPWPIRSYRKVEIASLDSDPILGSPVEGALRHAGFERESEKLVLWSAKENHR